MKKTSTVLVLAIGAVTIGISVAPAAGADTSSCRQVGAATVCGQGVNTGGQPAGPAAGAGQPGSGCTNAYGGYQNCSQH